MNYDKSAKKSHLTCALWSEDSAGHMDEGLTFNEDVSASANSGAVKRAAFFNNSQVVDLLGHLHCDIFNQEQLIPNGVELRRSSGQIYG